MLFLPTAAPPAPCNTIVQISDAALDGHHDGTDVLAAWWSEASGHLQAVIKVRSGLWSAQHDNADVNGTGYELLYAAGGQARFVRARGPAQDRASDRVLYDYGTVAADGTLQSAGTTTGATEPGAGGTVTIDVPAVAAGTTLTDARVLTYDGINGGVPDWVDHAPGGVAPDDPARGADYVVGSCNAAPPPPGATPVTTSIQLSAPARVKGLQMVTVSGRLAPARAGVTVTLAQTANKKTTTATVASAADGSFSARVAVGETTRLRAVAENVASSEVTVTAFTKVKIKVKRTKGGGATVTGTVDPKLPGRVQWLRTNAVTPSARTSTRNGTFRLRLKHPRRGRYQAVVIPTGGRAERATSNTGVIR